MYHPSRGGVRGGRDQFNWEDVKGDKHRENYLGHSIKAPVGRWQKGKDLHWYTRDRHSEGDAAKEEIKRIQEEEDDAMQEMLGLAPRKVNRRQGNLLNEREISELLKKGKDADESAPSLAAGERVEGLGFAPAPPQTEPGQSMPKRVAMQHHPAPVISGTTKLVELEGPKGENASNGDVPVNGESPAAPMGRRENESASSSSEEESASRRKRKKEERRRAKEQRREQNRARKQARLENRARRSETEEQAVKSQKRRKESNDIWRRDTQDGDGTKGDARHTSLSHISETTEMESFPKARVSENRRTRHDSDSSEGYERVIQRQVHTNASTKRKRDDRSYPDDGRGKAGQDGGREEVDMMREVKDGFDSDGSEREKWISFSRHSRNRTLYNGREDDKRLDSRYLSAREDRRDSLQSGRGSAYKESSGDRALRQYDREGSMHDAGRSSRNTNVVWKMSSSHEQSTRDGRRDERSRGETDPGDNIYSKRFQDREGSENRHIVTEKYDRKLRESKRQEWRGNSFAVREICHEEKGSNTEWGRRVGGDDKGEPKRGHSHHRQSGRLNSLERYHIGGSADQPSSDDDRGRY